MTIQRLPGSAITPGTITVTQLDSATATVIQTGGGPKITNIQVTDAAYTVLDDTAVDTAGGNIRITGTGFVTGCSVIVGSQPANSVAFVSSTEVRVQVGAQSAGTYIVYLVNPDGGVGIRVNGLTYSANPAWQTASALPDQYDGVAISLSLVATEATSYTITSGSLPPGLSLNANTGVITGTVTGVSVDTLYTFTVRATDAQLQDSPRTFTVTITVSDPYFRLTSLLLSGSAVSANTVVRDSSTNNFNLTVLGDARASNFTPYGSGWSNLFNSNRLNITTTGFAPGTGNFTVEAWIYPTSYNSASAVLTVTTTGGLWLGKLNSNWVLRAYSVADQLTTTTLPTLNTWTHVAWVRNGSTATIYFNGNSVVSGTVTYNFVSGSLAVSDDGAGGSYFLGYISNLRYTTTAVYTANFTPATTNLTALAGTQLLTCQDNRFRDTSANAYTITTTGTPTVSSFNPFNITNTGVNGSMYFDGTGDYLSTSNPAFAVGTGAFTIEAWVYPFNVSSKIVGSLASSVDPAGDRGIGFYTDGARIGRSVTAQFDDISTSIMPVAYQWNHIALVRENTSTNGVKFYVNGLLGGQGTSAISVNKQQVVVGRQYPSEDASYFSGYISSVRWTNAAVYTSAFTPPTSPLAAIANTQLLTLQYDQPHNNHTFLDSSSNQFVVTRSGNTTQGTFSPFSQSGWCNYFPSNAYLSIGTTAAFSFGTGDFTAEGWIYTNSTTVCMFDARSAGSATPWVLNAGSGSNTYWYDGTSYTSSIGITLGQWNHVAAARQSGVLRIFVNGQQGYSASHTVNQDRTAGIRIGDVVQTGQNWTGYLSNLRIVKGQALYTGSFTPPTTVLATNSVGTTGANVAVSITSPVSLLTAQSNRFIDNSSNNFAITATNSPQVQAFSPFTVTAIYNPAIHGGSAYFDGTGDKLSIPDNDAAFNFGSGDFTVEAWVYPVSSGVTSGRPFYNQSTSGGSTDSAIYVECVSDGVTIYVSVGTGWTYNATSGTLSLGYQWNHVAGVRSGTSLSIYVNGTRAATTTLPANWTMGNSTRIIEIGSQADAAYLNGYISGLRVIRNQALYSGTTYTIPTGPLTTTANTTCLLNFTDAAIIDSTGRNALETLGDAKTSSVVTKFTGGSMSFDGTGDYLQSSAPLSELAFLHNGTPWTVEGWFYTGSTSAQYIVGTDAASASIGMVIGLNDTNTRDITAQIFRGVSGSWLLAIGPTNSWSLNTWTHFAATLDSSKNLTVYINGVQVATASGSSFAFSSANPSYPLVVGRYQSPTPGGYFNGYISDLRVTRGYARYTANFTAPIVPARLK